MNQPHPPEPTRVAPPESAPLGRRIVRTAIALGLLLGVSAGLYQLWLIEPLLLPIRTVKIEGEIRQLSPQRLQDTVLANLHRGLLTQSLGDLKTAVEALPRVRTARLRRQWPDRLILEVHEHVPLARWGDDGLVTAEGLVFRPEEPIVETHLPRLAGPDRESVAVVRRYQAWAPRFEAIGYPLEGIEQSVRGAWSLRFHGGLMVAVGRSDVDERIERFLSAYRQLLAIGRPEQVDLRYGNGLAVRWPVADAPTRAAKPAPKPSPSASPKRPQTRS